MFRFERTADMELVRGIMTHPAIWPHIGDDATPAREQWRPIEHPDFRYVLAHDAELLGLWMFARQNAATWEVHTCLLPEARGRAREAARECARWFWREHAAAQRLVTQVPQYNRLARKLAECAGMTRYGLNPRAWRKHGQLHDLILLGMSRPEEN